MLKVVAIHGKTKVESPKFKTHKAAYKWLKGYYLNGYSITIYGKAKG